MKKITLSLAVAVLSSLLFVQVAANNYDPWLDNNDDGKIDIYDVVEVASAYGSVGTPINKTAMLLDLWDRVSLIENSLDRTKFIRFVEPNQTEIYGMDEWITAAEFTWTPDNPANNVILAVCYYGEYRIVADSSQPAYAYWRIQINQVSKSDHEIIAWGETNWTWLLAHHWAFTESGSNPNQVNYTIKFQCCSRDGTLYFRNINAILIVADGLSSWDG